MDEEQVRNAFARAKQDINQLNTEISIIKSELQETKNILKSFLEEWNTLKLHEVNTSTLRQITSTHPATKPDTSTVPQEIGGLNTPNLGISIGNEGASTDRQTDRQTDNSTQKQVKYPLSQPEYINSDIESDIQQAADILDSLDHLKKGIRLKFKQITTQEMTVFSTIYQLEEQNKQPTTYKEIALKLKLSQSSIRDYVQRMINKGIPIKKQRINNKKIVLSISEELKRIATLNTIIQLRGL